jgi:hypothetical protein
LKLPHSLRSPVGRLYVRDDGERADCERHRQWFAEGDRRFNGDGSRYEVNERSGARYLTAADEIEHNPQRQAEDPTRRPPRRLDASHRNAGSRRAVPRAPSAALCGGARFFRGITPQGNYEPAVFSGLCTANSENGAKMDICTTTGHRNRPCLEDLGTQGATIPPILPAPPVSGLENRKSELSTLLALLGCSYSNGQKGERSFGIRRNDQGG